MKETTLIINKILDDCKLKFGVNLWCILQLGSTLVKKSKPNDIDIIIILKFRETTKDIFLLKEIIKNIKYPLDIQIINLEDINGWNFSHFSHGQFFICFLKGAKTIYGENPFNEIVVEDNYLISSVSQKAQYYYFRAKKFFLENKYGNNIISKKDFLYHRKKIFLMMADYWLVVTNGEIDIKKGNCKQVLDDLNLCKFYLSNLDFFEKQYYECTFEDFLKIYQKVYFAITDSLNKEARKRKIIK